MHPAGRNSGFADLQRTAAVITAAPTHPSDFMRSIYPRRFQDDGTSVTVDLHGCTVPDAMQILRRTLQKAADAGRAKVVAIHGTSTTDQPDAPTIKAALARALDAGSLDEWVTGAQWSGLGGECTLWLPIGTPSRPARINVREVVAS